METEEKLNIGLKFLANNLSNGESYDRYSKLKDYLKTIKEIPSNEYAMIVLHLVDDGYVRMYEFYQDITIGTEQIKVTYKGYIFINNGGYVQEKKDSNRHRIIEKIHHLTLSIGTALAGLYAAKEVLVWLHNHFCR